MDETILYDEVLTTLRERFPKLKIEYKNESWFWKLLPARWSKNTTTTYLQTVRFPDRASRNWKILAHENIHLIDEAQRGSFRFIDDFLFPQICGLWWILSSIVSLIFISLLTPLDWLGVILMACGLLFFLPWPSKKRFEMEQRAYTMSLCINYWRYGTILDTTKDWIAETLSSWSYYKMMWSKKKARIIVDKMARDIIDTKGKNMLIEPGFMEIYKIIKKHYPKQESK